MRIRFPCNAFFHLHILRIVGYLMDPHAYAFISKLILSLGLETEAIGLDDMTDFSIKAVIWIVSVLRLVVRSTSIASWNSSSEVLILAWLLCPCRMRKVVLTLKHCGSVPCYGTGRCNLGSLGRKHFIPLFVTFKSLDVQALHDVSFAWSDGFAIVTRLFVRTAFVVILVHVHDVPSVERSIVLVRELFHSLVAIPPHYDVVWLSLLGITRFKVLCNYLLFSFFECVCLRRKTRRFL